MNQFLCETFNHNAIYLNDLDRFHKLDYKVNNRKGLKANSLPNINVKQNCNNQDICYLQKSTIKYKLMLAITTN